MAWELKGKYPRIFDDASIGDGRARICSTTPRRCWTEIVRPSACCRPKPSTASGRPPPLDDDIVVFADDRAQRGAGYLPHAATAVGEDGTERASARWPTTSRRWTADCADYLGGFVADRRHRGRRTGGRVTKRTTTTTTRSWSRRWPIGWRKPSPSGCTNRCAPSGVTAGRAADARGADRREVSRHPAGARLSGPTGPHREAHAVSRARRRAARSASQLTETFAMSPAASVCGLYFAHPQARYFAVGRLARDQVEDYAARKGSPGRRSRAVAAPESGVLSDGGVPRSWGCRANATVGSPHCVPQSARRSWAVN